MDQQSTLFGGTGSEAMERSATGRDTRDEGIASMYSGIYRAMLAAAPRP